MLDLLDNLPRLWLSDDHMKVIIWAMHECSTPRVPSFSALRQLQSWLGKEADIQPKHHTSCLGNYFFMNHPLDLLSMVSILNMILLSNLILLDLPSPFQRTGQTHLCVSIYMCTQRYAIQYLSPGKWQNGLTKSAWMNSHQCGQTGRGPNIATFM